MYIAVKVGWEKIGVLRERGKREVGKKKGGRGKGEEEKGKETGKREGERRRRRGKGKWREYECCGLEGRDICRRARCVRS